MNAHKPTKKVSLIVKTKKSAWNCRNIRSEIWITKQSYNILLLVKQMQPTVDCSHQRIFLKYRVFKLNLHIWESTITVM